MLVAAGRAGAMPFVLALQYGIPVGAIARTNPDFDVRISS